MLQSKQKVALKAVKYRENKEKCFILLTSPKNSAILIMSTECCKGSAETLTYTYERSGTVRDYLKQLREDRGLSMQDIADKLDISRQYYQMIESGERQKKMDITLVRGIATALNVSLESIIEEENRITEAGA